MKTRSDADVIMKQLTAHGYKPFLQEYSGKPSGKWYRIRVGHFATKAEADSLAFTLVHLEKLADSRVMREP